MNESDLKKDKIPDAKLYQFANEKSDQTIVVIIEIDLPSRQVEFSKNLDRSIGFIRILPETSGQQSKNSHKINAAREFLMEVTGTEPQWLHSARAFISRVTPEQIRTISRSPLIKSIKPNRHLELSNSLEYV